MGRFGEDARAAAYELLNHNLVTVVASDAHSPVHRTTCMADAYDYLREEYPAKYLDILFDVNPRNICNGAKTIQFRRIPFERNYGWKGACTMRRLRIAVAGLFVLSLIAFIAFNIVDRITADHTPPTITSESDTVSVTLKPERRFG